jgi:hypothetical protein
MAAHGGKSRGNIVSTRRIDFSQENPDSGAVNGSPIALEVLYDTTICPAEEI